VAVASVAGAAINRITGRRSDDDERPAIAPPAPRTPQPVIASALEAAGPARAGRALRALP
ncbi:hypothetical protein MNEG_16630, partial [Monoraphidium neglectum]